MEGLLVLYSTILLFFLFSYPNRVQCIGLLELFFSPTLIVNLRGMPGGG